MKEEILKGFNAYWAESLHNKLTNAISENNKQNIDIFEECILNNQDTKTPLKYIIPASTGTGKTQITGFYIAKTLDRGFKSIVVVERTQSADELRELILKLSSSLGDTVNTFHSKESSSAKNIKQAIGSQVLIITHNKFNDILVSHNDTDDFTLSKYHQLIGDRDLIIIDEAISTIEEISISKDTLYSIVAELKSLMTTVDKSNKEAYKHEIAIIETLAEDLTRHHDNPKLDTDIMPYTKQLDDIIPSAEVLPISMKLLGAKSIETLTVLDKIFNSDIQYLYKKGSDIYIKTVKEILPNKSLVVLDATASINVVYQEYAKHTKGIKIVPRIDCRTYDNVTIHTVTTATGKETILPNKEKVCSELAESILEQLNPSDKVLVVVHKDMEVPLLTYLGTYKNIFINHWGNLTGTNLYDECNKIYIYGLYHKPLYLHYNNYRLSGNKFSLNMLLDADERAKIQQIAVSDLASELIQAINRIRIRRVADDKGGCSSAEIYITLPQTNNAYILKAIASELPNAKVLKDWTLSNALTKADRQGHTEALIQVLNEFVAQGKFFIKRDEARKLIDDSPEYINIFRANINKPTTKAALKLAGFQLDKKAVKDTRGRINPANGFLKIS